MEPGKNSLLGFQVKYIKNKIYNQVGKQWMLEKKKKTKKTKLLLEFVEEPYTNSKTVAVVLSQINFNKWLHGNGVCC